MMLVLSSLKSTFFQVFPPSVVLKIPLSGLKLKKSRLPASTMFGFRGSTINEEM